MTNPLLSPWTAPFGLPPFADIRDEDFAPAFEAALADARGRIAVIAGEPAAPTFANLIEALELAEETLDRVSAVFYNLAGADATPAVRRSRSASRATERAARTHRSRWQWQSRSRERPSQPAPRPDPE